MRHVLAVSLALSSAFTNPAAVAQQTTTPPPAAVPATATTPPTTLPTAPPPPNTLLDGTAIKLRLAENLSSATAKTGQSVSSATAKTGQSVSFEVTEDVLVQGVVVLAKGSQALATVTDAATKKSMGRGGKLDVNVDSARLADGEKVLLRAVRDAKGGGHMAVMTGAMVATAIVFFPAAPLFLFIHGKDITIPKGTEVTAFVEGDTKLDMAKFAPNASESGTLAANPSGLSIDASIANCDIEVDGAFMGNTPSTLTLTPGKHDIVVKKTGYQDWTRSMTVGGGAVRVNADMVAK